MREKRWICIGLCVLGLVTAGCGKTKELPEDTPWNHGSNAIMETDEGYYYNNSTNSFTPWRDQFGDDSLINGQGLRYYEKETGVTIMLCNKPECEHLGGDDCEASYRRIRTVNTQLYDGKIYILGMDYEGDLVSINLYKGALDGSALDKVGTVIQAENLKQESISHPSTSDGFLIHKGYAYIPYYLRFGQASKTYMGGGLAKMDIATGEVQMIFDCSTVSSDFPILDAGVGDYIYFHGSKKWSGYRYVISEDRVEETKQLVRLEENGDFTEIPVTWQAFSKERNYGVAYQVGEDLSGDGQIVMTAYDAVTGERKWEEDIYTDIFVKYLDPMSGEYRAVCYDGMIFISMKDMAYFYSTEGEKLAQIQAPDLGVSKAHAKHADNYSFKISREKLYVICRDYDGEKGKYSYPIDYKVYCCPLEEVFAGNSTWTEAFQMDNHSGRFATFGGEYAGD